MHPPSPLSDTLEPHDVPQASDLQNPAGSSIASAVHRWQPTGTPVAKLGILTEGGRYDLADPATQGADIGRSTTGTCGKRTRCAFGESGSPSAQPKWRSEQNRQPGCRSTLGSMDGQPGKGGEQDAMAPLAGQASEETAQFYNATFADARVAVDCDPPDPAVVRVPKAVPSLPTASSGAGMPGGILAAAQLAQQPDGDGPLLQSRAAMPSHPVFCSSGVTGSHAVPPLAGGPTRVPHAMEPQLQHGQRGLPAAAAARGLLLAHPGGGDPDRLARTALGADMPSIRTGSAGGVGGRGQGKNLSGFAGNGGRGSDGDCGRGACGLSREADGALRYCRLDEATTVTAAARSRGRCGGSLAAGHGEPVTAQVAKQPHEDGASRGGAAAKHSYPCDVSRPPAYAQPSLGLDAGMCTLKVSGVRQAAAVVATALPLGVESPTWADAFPGPSSAAAAGGGVGHRGSPPPLPMGVTLPPVMAARLRKKIRIIQPISQAWVEETLQSSSGAVAGSGVASSGVGLSTIGTGGPTAPAAVTGGVRGCTAAQPSPFVREQPAQQHCRPRPPHDHQQQLLGQKASGIAGASSTDAAVAGQLLPRQDSSLSGKTVQGGGERGARPSAATAWTCGAVPFRSEGSCAVARAAADGRLQGVSTDAALPSSGTAAASAPALAPAPALAGPAGSAVSAAASLADGISPFCLPPSGAFSALATANSTAGAGAGGMMLPPRHGSTSSTAVTVSASATATATATAPTAPAPLVHVAPFGPVMDISRAASTGPCQGERPHAQAASPPAATSGGLARAGGLPSSAAGLSSRHHGQHVHGTACRGLQAASAAAAVTSGAGPAGNPTYRDDPRVNAVATGTGATQALGLHHAPLPQPMQPPLLSSQSTDDLGKAQTELSLLYQWYVANKNVYLNQAHHQLQRVEALTTAVINDEGAAAAAAAAAAGSGDGASAAAAAAAAAGAAVASVRAESAEAVRAFETALKIMRVCGSVEQRWLAPPAGAAAGAASAAGQAVTAAPAHTATGALAIGSQRQALLGLAPASKDPRVAAAAAAGEGPPHRRAAGARTAASAASAAATAAGLLPPATTAMNASGMCATVSLCPTVARPVGWSHGAGAALAVAAALMGTVRGDGGGEASLGTGSADHGYDLGEGLLRVGLPTGGDTAAPKVRVPSAAAAAAAAPGTVPDAGTCGVTAAAASGQGPGQVQGLTGPSAPSPLAAKGLAASLHADGLSGPRPAGAGLPQRSGPLPPSRFGPRDHSAGTG